MTGVRGIIRLGFALLAVGMAILVPIVPAPIPGWTARAAARRRLRARAARVAAQQLHALADLRGAGERGGRGELGGGSFGLSFGLAFAGAIMLAALSFVSPTGDASAVLCPRSRTQVAHVLEDDAEIMSDAQLADAARRPAAGGAGRDPPHQHRGPTEALQIALLVPLLAALLGLFERVPDDAPTRPEAVGGRRELVARLTRVRISPARAGPLRRRGATTTSPRRSACRRRAGAARRWRTARRP